MNSISPSRHGFRRTLRFELMESRQMMASDLCQHNLAMPNDVDGDQQVSPIDALAIINQLNGSKSSASADSAISHLYLDVNNDGFVSPIDVLSVINTLNQKSISSESSTQRAGAKAVTETSSDDSSNTSATPSIDTNCDTSENTSTTVLVATVTGTAGGSATATFKTTTQNSTIESELVVIGKGLTPDSKLNVVVAGVTVGQLPTDASGNGTLKFATTPTSTDESAIPTDFPAIDTKTTIQIGTDATGTFAVPTTPDTPARVPEHHHGNGHHGLQDHHGHQQEANETELRLLLQGTGTQTGQVKFETETEDGATITKLIVSVANLTASTTVDVVVDGITVGKITTDAKGAGRLNLSSSPRRANELPLPADFPTIGSSSTIAIGTELKGSFADRTKPTTTVPAQPANKTVTPAANITPRIEDVRESHRGHHRGQRLR